MSQTCPCGRPFVRTEYQPELHCPSCGSRPADTYMANIRKLAAAYDRRPPGEGPCRGGLAGEVHKL
jgi:hypothetical protein